MLDSQHIIICEAKRDRSIKRRFVRLDRSAPDFEETLISATILRQALRIQEAERLRESVEAMALSPELLLTMAGISGPDQDIAMIDPPCTETLENADDGKSKELLTSDGSGEDGKVGAESCKMDVYDTKGLPDGFYFDQSG